MQTDDNPFYLKTPKNTTAISLNSKTGHVLYQTISILSTIPNAENMNLYNEYQSISELASKPPAEINFFLKKLIEDNLIEQLFYLDYRDEKPVIIHCFIAIPPTGNESIPEKLFYAINNRSVQNIANFIENHLLFNKDLYLEELEKNLHSETEFSAENYPNALFSLISKIETIPLTIPLKMGSISESIKLIEEELIRLNKIIIHSQDIYIPINQSDVLARYSIASNFIKNRLTVFYNQILGNALDEIEKNETIHYFNSPQEPVNDFTKKRAEIIHGIAKSVYKAFYPGHIAISTVLNLHKDALEKWQEVQTTDIEADFQKFKDKFLKSSQHWTEMIHFIDEKTYANYHALVWEKLQEDANIIFTTWTTKEEPLRVFMNNSADIIKTIIRSMLLLYPEQGWKVLAFRKILDENDITAKRVFSDQAYVKLYGRLLKRAYKDYFPWYYFLIIPFWFGQDYLFKTAKIKIADNQLKLKSAYLDKLKAREKVQKNEIEKKLEKNKEEYLKKVILFILDNFYLKKNQLITVNDILANSKGTDREEIIKTLKNENFRLIKQSQKSFEESIVLYPVDKEWREKESQLKAILFKRIESMIPKTSEEKKDMVLFKMIYQSLMK